MVFSSNPLSLSVPESAFESWLRDSGYLELIDQRSSDHRPSTNSATRSPYFFSCFFSSLSTLLTLFTLNPFSKLTTEDFAGETPSWTLNFIGDCGSYSFPTSPSQLRLRVPENVKRYARNYASLLILASVCALYQMPLALLGLISSLALWDLFKFCNGRWALDHYPVIRQVLICIVQCATAAILFYSNVQGALFGAFCVSYAAMVLHASCRKLAAPKLSSRGRWK